MPERFVVSRRKAALMLAGSVAGAATLAVGTENAVHTVTAASPDGDVHGELLRRLAEIRGTLSAAGRARAFDAFKGAFVRHNVTEALAARRVSGLRASGGSGLYRRESIATMHAEVLVRELETTAVHDADWIERFGDLEDAIHAHIAEHDAA